MKEPLPKYLLPPVNEEELNVGIIIKEDKKTQITITVDSPNYKFISNNQFIELKINTPYLLKNDAGQISVNILNADLTLENLFLSRGSIKILSNSSHKLAPKSGLSVIKAPLGRGFHWESQEDMIFSGDFEIFPNDQYLLLVNKIKFEDYLACVSASEMSSESPIEFCKAQIVSARSWAFTFLKHKHTGTPYTICNDDDCQRYRGTTDLSQNGLEAMRQCRGEFLITEEGYVCPAYYSKSCGGITESSENIFGFKAKGISSILDLRDQSRVLNLNQEHFFKEWIKSPTSKNIYCSEENVNKSQLEKYLSKVDVSEDYFRWDYRIKKETLINNLKSKFKISNISKILDFKIKGRGHSGRILKAELYYLTNKGEINSLTLEDQYEVRKALHPSFLFSSAFTYDLIKEGSEILEIKMTGAGWGHGVGLCQIGAIGMALEGRNYLEILKHYFPETRLKKGY